MYRPEYKFKTKEFDDKKGKYQSCEYTIKEEETQLYIINFGETMEEAKEECIKELDIFIEELLKFRKTLE